MEAAAGAAPLALALAPAFALLADAATVWLCVCAWPDDAVALELVFGCTLGAWSLEPSPSARDRLLFALRDEADEEEVLRARADGADRPGEQVDEEGPPSCSTAALSEPMLPEDSTLPGAFGWMLRVWLPVEPLVASRGRGRGDEGNSSASEMQLDWGGCGCCCCCCWCCCAAWNATGSGVSFLDVSRLSWVCELDLETPEEDAADNASALDAPETDRNALEGLYALTGRLGELRELPARLEHTLVSLKLSASRLCGRDRFGGR